VRIPRSSGLKPEGCVDDSWPNRCGTCVLFDDADDSHCAGLHLGWTIRHPMTERECHVRGLAFDIPDLILVRYWAERHNYRISIRLDHGVFASEQHAEEYEKVIAFLERPSSLCRLIMWRDAAAVFVQPLAGRARQYSSVKKALDSIRLRREPW
jgi:hypothetical protein